MSLYDDDDPVVTASKDSSSVTGWSKSASWIQTQQNKSLAAKKKSLLSGMNRVNRPASVAPVVNLKSRNSNSVGDTTPKSFTPYGGGDKIRGDKSMIALNDPSWTVVNEYDPLWPNEFNKVSQEIRDSKRRNDDDSPDSKRRRYTETGRDRTRDRFGREDPSPGHVTTPGGFGRRPVLGDDYSDDEEDDRRRSRRSGGGGGDQRPGRNSGSSSNASSSSSSSLAGAAIAPPPSLTESSNGNNEHGNNGSPTPPNATPSMVQRLGNTPAQAGGSLAGLGIAAKIMAKYGYKQGQGLGRDEQGMSMALSVEKTSKRGGRIVHEKDLMPPPVFGGGGAAASDINTTPPYEGVGGAADGPPSPPGAGGMMMPPPAAPGEKEKPSITDLMRNPSKVVMCKNMVGPGEVDDDLEPEIKEECNTKYGDVNKVIIFEIQNTSPEEAVRIFIEFKRVESAIKAVVDLNGRFFGGREVAASFYEVDKFNNLQLTD